MKTISIRKYKKKIIMSVAITPEQAEYLKNVPNKSEFVQKSIDEKRLAANATSGEPNDPEAVSKIMEGLMRGFSEFRDDTRESMVKAMQRFLYIASVGDVFWFGLGNEDPQIRKAVFSGLRERLEQAYQKRWKEYPPRGWDRSFMGDTGRLLEIAPP